MDEYQLETLLVSLTGEATGYMQMLQQAQASTEAVSRQVEESARGIEGLGQALVNFGGYVTSALASLGLGSKLLGTVQDYEGQEQANRRLKALLVASGQEVDRNFEKLSRVSEELQKHSVYADEANLSLMAQATAMGLTADAARRATENAIALAAVWQTSPTAFLRQTAMLEQGFVGRLQFFIPVLRSIKDPAEKAKKAYEELHKMFAMVKADTETYTGQTRQLANAWGDFKEIIGKTVVVYLQPLLDLKRKLVDSLGKFSEGLKFALVSVGMLGVALLALGPMMALLAPLGTLIMAPLAAAGVELLHFMHLSTILKLIWVPLWFVIKSVGFVLLTMLSPIKLLVTTSLVLVWAWNAMWSPAGIAFFTILKIVAVIAIFVRQAGTLEQLWKNIVQGARDFWKWLEPIRLALAKVGMAGLERVLHILDEVGKEMVDLVKKVLAIDTFDWAGLFEGLRTHAVGALKFVAYAIEHVGDVWEALMAAFTEEWNRIMEVINPVLEFIQKRILDVVTAVYEWLRANIGLLAGLGGVALGAFIVVDAVLLLIVIVKAFVAAALLVNWVLGVLGVRWVLQKVALLAWYAVLGLAYGLLNIYSVALWGVTTAFAALEGMLAVFGGAMRLVNAALIAGTMVVGLFRLAQLGYSLAVAVATGTTSAYTAVQIMAQSIMAGYLGTTALAQAVTTALSAATEVAAIALAAFSAIMVVTRGTLGGLTAAAGLAKAGAIAFTAAMKIAGIVSVAFGVVMTTVTEFLRNYETIMTIVRVGLSAFMAVVAQVKVIMALFHLGVAVGVVVFRLWQTAMATVQAIYSLFLAKLAFGVSLAKLLAVTYGTLIGVIRSVSFGVMLARYAMALLFTVALIGQGIMIGLVSIFSFARVAATALGTGVLVAVRSMDLFRAIALVTGSVVAGFSLVVQAAQAAVQIFRGILTALWLAFRTGAITVYIARAAWAAWLLIMASFRIPMALVLGLISAGKAVLGVFTAAVTVCQATWGAFTAALVMGKTILLGVVSVATASAAAVSTVAGALATVASGLMGVLSAAAAAVAVLVTLGAVATVGYSAFMGLAAALGAVGTLLGAIPSMVVLAAGAEMAANRAAQGLRNAAIIVENEVRRFQGLAPKPLVDADLGSWEKALGVLGEWWEYLKRIWGVIKAGDYTLAWRLFVGAARVAIAQVQAMWPSLWDILYTTATSTWDIIVVYFTTEFYKAFSSIIGQLKGMLGSIVPEGLIGFLERSSNRYDHATAAALRSLKGPHLEEESRRIAEKTARAQSEAMEKAKAAVQDAILRFNFEGDNDAIRAAREALGGIVAEADEKIRKFEDQMNPKSYELGKGMGEQIKRGLHDGLRDMDAVLTRSAEAMWRVLDYRERLGIAPFGDPRKLRGLHGESPQAPEALENAVMRGNRKGDELLTNIRDALVEIKRRPQPNIGLAALA